MSRVYTTRETQRKFSWHGALCALMSVWPFQVRIKMRRHQAGGLRSLLLDLPDLGQRFGTLTSCLLISGDWLFRYTSTTFDPVHAWGGRMSTLHLDRGSRRVSVSAPPRPCPSPRRWGRAG